MVQSVVTRKGYQGVDDLVDAREFWKIKCRNDMTCAEIKLLLRAQNYGFLSTALKVKLVEQHMRWQRGLLNYEKCSYAELRVFASERGILKQGEARKPPLMRDLLVRLNKADDDKTFSRFLELPAELRLRIYEMHFHGFDTDNHRLPAPVPVPITAVSSQIRRESLPVYYSTCTFDFDADKIFGIDLHAKNLPRSYTLMQDFIHKGPSEQIAMLRKVRMYGPIAEPHWTGAIYLSGLELDFTVDFGTSHKPGTVNRTPAEDKDDDNDRDWGWEAQDAEALREAALSNFRDIVSGMDRREGGKKLLAGDIRAISAIFKYDGRYSAEDDGEEDGENNGEDEGYDEGDVGSW